MATNHAVVLYEQTETSPEVVTIAGFLAGYSGRTREADTLDLRQFLRWIDEHRLDLFAVTRTHIEVYARQLEDEGKAPSTIGRRISTLAGFYRYAVEEGVLEHSPAVHVRRPKVDCESHTAGLDRNELGGFLVQAGLSSPRDHALASLLGLNGLRISEALGANIENLSLERGHRTLLVHRKGGKTVTIPLAPRTARAMDLAIGERLEGPIFLGASGDRMTRDAAARMVKRLAKKAGITKKISPHSLRHSFITAEPSMPVSRSATSRRRRRTPTLGRRCATTGPANPWTGTPPTSSPRSLPARAAVTPAAHRPDTADHHGNGAPQAGALRNPNSVRIGLSHSARQAARYPAFGAARRNLWEHGNRGAARDV